MLYIRTDMNDIIATGHLMRCLAIADAARCMGEETMFILADGQAAGLLSDRGYGCIVLDTPWDDMEKELPVLEEVIRQHKITKLLVDSYQVTEAYFRRLKENHIRICYLDDLNAFSYDVDTLICYEIYGASFHYEKKDQPDRLYLGTDYAPLKKEFCNCGPKRIRKNTECVLLLSGGMAAHGFLDQLLEQMDRKAYREIHVVCGRSHTGYQILCEKYNTEENVKLHQFVTDLDVLMKRADLAVSAGGVTIYELCACGTPAISYALADNQLETVRKFAEDGVIDYAGDIRRDPVAGNVIRYMERYKENQIIRQERSCKMQKLVDGKGAFRIAGILMDRKGKQYDTKLCGTKQRHTIWQAEH